MDLLCGKVDQMCRVCLCHTSTNLAPLFPFPSESSTADGLAEKIYLCTRIHFRHDPSLPRSICHSCLDELEVADRFRNKCLTSNQILQGYDPENNDQAIINNKSMHLPQAKDKALSITAEEIDLQPINVEIEEHKPIVVMKQENELEDQSEENDSVIDKSSVIKPKMNLHICQECGKGLKTEASMLRHKVTMHTQRRGRPGRVTGHGAERRFHCTECPYSSPHSQSLVYHVRRHTGERPHRCECGLAFTQPSSLAAHRKTHSDTTYYTCSQCGKQFKHKDVYERHKTVHSEAKYSCVVCGKALKTQHTLDSHMNRHLGLKNFSCETCGAAFVTRVELINHRKKHDGPRRFQCTLCSYNTYLKKLLDVHIKRHTGEREYKCELCPYDCHTRSELKCHQRTHTKEKRYACAACGQRFVYSTSLNKHMLRRHSLKFVWSSTVDRRVVKAIS